MKCRNTSSKQSYPGNYIIFIENQIDKYEKASAISTVTSSCLRRASWWTKVSATGQKLTLINNIGKNKTEARKGKIKDPGFATEQSMSYK